MDDTADLVRTLAEGMRQSHSSPSCCPECAEAAAMTALELVQSKFRISRIGEGETFDSGEHPITDEHVSECETCRLPTGGDLE